MAILGNPRDQLRHHSESYAAADAVFGANDYSRTFSKDFVPRLGSGVQEFEFDREEIGQMVVTVLTLAPKHESTKPSSLPLRFSSLSQSAHVGWKLLRGQIASLIQEEQNKENELVIYNRNMINQLTPKI